MRCTEAESAAVHLPAVLVQDMAQNQTKAKQTNKTQGPGISKAELLEVSFLASISLLEENWGSQPAGPGCSSVRVIF